MKYWAYVRNEILGPFEKEKLLELPEFSPSLLICPQTPVGEKTEDWKEASGYPEIAALIGGQGGASAPAASAMPPATGIGDSSPMSPSPSPAASPLGEPSALSPAQSSPAPETEAAGPGGASGEAIQLEPRADAAPPADTGGLKHLNPTALNPADISHKEAGGAFDIPVVKLSGELGSHGKIGHPGTIQSEGLHNAENDTTPVAGEAAQQAPAEPAPAEAAPPPQAAPEPAPVQEAPAAAIPEPAAPAAEPSVQAAQAEAKNFSPSFDPISLSSIGGRNKPPEAAPAAQPEAATSEPAAAPAPAQEPAAASAPAAPAFDPAVIEEMIKRNLKLAASPPPDIRPHLDPLVIKMDQMGEILSSMRNSQFQQEVLTKIRLIEDSISELRKMIGDKQEPPAEKSGEKPKTSGLFGFGAGAKKEAPPAEKAPEPEPAGAPVKEQVKEQEIVDEGSKGASSGSKAGAAVKKIMRGLVTLLLLAAVLGGAAFMLRNLGIFDVTPYIPFAVPGLTPAEAPDGGQPETGPAAAQEEAAVGAEGAPGEQPPAGEPSAADVSPEIVFVVRTYSAKEGGEILESKIFADAIKKDGDINNIEWKVSPPEGDNYRAEAVIPVKGGKPPIVYAFTVERGNKRVTPNNLEGREVMQELFGQKPAAPKTAARKPAKKSSARSSSRRTSRAPAKKIAPKPAPKPRPKATPVAAPVAAPAEAPAEEELYDDDEYEYVYVEEEEAGGGDEAEYLMPGFGGQ